MTKLVWSLKAWDDYCLWQTQDKKLLKRINKLIKEILRSPFTGIGNPEPLKHNLAGCWSRRINSEHRVVYRITDNSIEIIACRFHY
jgi:toxin YoeB